MSTRLNHLLRRGHVRLVPLDADQEAGDRYGLRGGPGERLVLAAAAVGLDPL